MNYTVFIKSRHGHQGATRVASGSAHDVVKVIKPLCDAAPEALFLAFEDGTGRQVDFDLRGSLDEVIARYPVEAPRPGRPKLGVVGRELSLLPRHWEWLERHPKGASAVVRTLVEQAMRQEPDPARKDAAASFLSAMAGNWPGFEEVTRALYAGDRERMAGLMEDWPEDVRAYAMRLSDPA